MEQSRKKSKELTDTIMKQKKLRVINLFGKIEKILILLFIE